MTLPSKTQIATTLLGAGLTYVTAHQFSSPWSTILPPLAALITALWHIYTPSPTQNLPGVNPWK